MQLLQNIRLILIQIVLVDREYNLRSWLKIWLAVIDKVWNILDTPSVTKLPTTCLACKSEAVLCIRDTSSFGFNLRISKSKS
jgi:hypothetical protein